MGAAQSPSLNDATKLVLFVFAIIVSTFAIGLLVFVCHRQRRRNRSNVPNSSGPAAYAPVAHQLDDEEIEFKKMLETQSDGIEGILGDDVDDLVFDSQVRKLVVLLSLFPSHDSRPHNNKDTHYHLFATFTCTYLHRLVMDCLLTHAYTQMYSYLYSHMHIHTHHTYMQHIHCRILHAYSKLTTPTYNTYTL